MYKIISFFIACSIGMLIGILLISGRQLDERTLETEPLPQVIRSVPIADVVDLGGERIPIERPDVRQRLDRELMVNCYWHSNMMYDIKLSNRFFPIIERILAEEGVPDDFKFLAVAESDLQLKTSYAGAKGYWQFMKAAGKQYGLEINKEVDERYDIVKSTRAAAKYLKSLHRRFGSWVNAAAAYNVGPTRFARIQKQQKSNNYFDLNLNHETSRYVFRVLAFKYIMSNPETYGFYVHDHEKYEPLNNFYTIQVDKTINSWADFAQQHGVSYRDLKIYNPWLIDSKLTVVKKKYNIKIPR